MSRFRSLRKSVVKQEMKLTQGCPDSLQLKNSPCEFQDSLLRLSLTHITNCSNQRLFLTLLVICVVTSSLLDIFPNPMSRNVIVRSFSVNQNVRKLFQVDAKRNQNIDLLKLIFSLVFVSMHSITGSDNPASPIIISKSGISQLAKSNSISR